MSLDQPHIFVTGGLGFIGSHTVLALLEDGCSVVIMDNLSNSFIEVYERMRQLAGARANRMSFHKVDLNDGEGLDHLFATNKFQAVVHFAGYKAVGESVQIPLEYYRNNLAGTVTLLEVMRKHNCKNIVFSSSCTVYGTPGTPPITEDTSLEAISPYGRTKLFQEEMFRDVAAADPSWRILLLRYFNPVGAHPTGDLGEHPIGVPNNLMPYIQQVALGQRDVLRVYGGDYPTPDGTAIRDYIHVMDLAQGHVAAVNKILGSEGYGCRAVNLGTGKGTSVLQMIAAFKAASGLNVNYQIVGRRPGDAVAVWAATDLAKAELGWECKYDVHDMCKHQWGWAHRHPNGFKPAAAAQNQSPSSSSVQLLS